MVKDQQQHKEEETKRLVQFIEENDLWVDNINIAIFIISIYLIKPKIGVKKGRPLMGGLFRVILC